MSFDPYTTPALAPPAGTIPNFIDPPSQMTAVIAGSTCIIVVVTLSVFLRIFTKACIVKKLHIEDYLSVLAWALLMCYNGTIIHLSIEAARHQWDISLAMLSDSLYWANIAYVLYAPVTAAAKLAVLFQIKRIFTTTNKNTFFYVVWASIILNCCFYLPIFFVYIFQCWPREAIWNFTVNGRCLDSNGINFATGIGNVISDLQALLLPAWAIWHLRVKITTKLSIFAVFAVGSIALIIGGVGMWVRVVTLTNPDFTWFGTQLAMLAVAEIAIVIIVGCMPVYPRLLRWFKQKAGMVPTEQGRLPGGPHQRNEIPPAFKRSRRTGKSDPDTDILVTQTQEFAHNSMDDRLELADYKIHVYNGSSTP